MKTVIRKQVVHKSQKIIKKHKGTWKIFQTWSWKNDCLFKPQSFRKCSGWNGYLINPSKNQKNKYRCIFWWKIPFTNNTPFITQEPTVWWDSKLGPLMKIFFFHFTWDRSLTHVKDNELFAFDPSHGSLIILAST